MRASSSRGSPPDTRSPGSSRRPLRCGRWGGGVDGRLASLPAGTAVQRCAPWGSRAVSRGERGGPIGPPPTNRRAVGVPAVSWPCGPPSLGALAGNSRVCVCAVTHGREPSGRLAVWNEVWPCVGHHW